MAQTKLDGRAGMVIHAENGREELGFPESMSTPFFYKAAPGDTLILKDDAYTYFIAAYAPIVEEQWLYTYSYAPDQSWTVYQPDLTGNRRQTGKYIFSSSMYFRLCLQKVSGECFDGSEAINDIISFERQLPDPSDTKPWLKQEVERAAQRVAALQDPDCMVFALLADSHYTVNGTWNDTAKALRLLHEKIRFNGIIHLGDLTDGMVTGVATRHYVEIVLADLKACGVPVWIALGNHDANYFKNNPERFSIEEQRALYLEGGELSYYVGFPKLRLIFLDSYNFDEEIRYGYSRECLRLLEEALEELNQTDKAIIFSHLPPVARLQYWTKTLRGEREMTDILTRYKGKILAWINGHNHADRLDNNEEVPVVSIGNAKCEAFYEHKTEGFITPERKLGEASQELFDVLMVNAEKGTARFVRFGAGSDRFVANGTADWLRSGKP